MSLVLNNRALTTCAFDTDKTRPTSKTVIEVLSISCSCYFYRSNAKKMLKVLIFAAVIKDAKTIILLKTTTKILDIQPEPVLQF